MSAVPSRVVIFACGDAYRGDDAVAWLAARGLPDAVRASAEVRFVGALEPEALTALPTGVKVIIVDALVGPTAGRIVEMDLRELGGRASPLRTTSSHQLPMDRVVGLAQLLRDEPVEGLLVGVGIESVAFGDELSEIVAKAIPALRDAVAAAVRRLS